VPKIKEHINAVPYADKRGLVYRYGEFLPPELCPFAYNESLARAHFPLTKEEALARGYMWKDREERKYAPTVQAENLPDDIKDVQDSITEELIACSHGGKCGDWCTVAYKIVPRELQFYRHLGVPLPRLCPNCRHDERMKEKRPMRLWRRACQCAGSTSSPQAGAKSLNGAYKNAAQHQHGENPCPNKFETSYSPEKPEIVYCEQCYNAEVA
jgi:hypothetical protein